MVEPLTTAERIVAAVLDSMSMDDALATLADSERRRLIAILCHVETPERMSVLTRSLAAEIERTGDTAVERLHVRLHHVHVPKLTDAGIVDVDSETKTVELTEQSRPLADAFSG